MKVLLSSDSLPSRCNGQSWPDPKSGAKSFLQVSHVGTVAQGLDPSSAASQFISWIGSEAAGRQIGAHMECLEVEHLLAKPLHWSLDISFLNIVIFCILSLGMAIGKIQL